MHINHTYIREFHESIIIIIIIIIFAIIIIIVIALQPSLFPLSSVFKIDPDNFQTGSPSYHLTSQRKSVPKQKRSE